MEKQERERGRGGKGVIRIVGGSVGWCVNEEGGCEEVGGDDEEEEEAEERV